MPLGKLPPMKFFCVLFHISSFYLYENFRRQKNLFSFNQFFDYKLVYSKCLHHFFLSVLFWFSAMAYTVYHTYMRDQQCWASLPGNMLFLQATLFFNSASVLLNILINWASNFAYVLLNNVSNIILSRFIYLLHLGSCLHLGLFMPYLRESIFIFVFIFIMINCIISWIQTCLFFCLFFRIYPVIVRW